MYTLPLGVRVQIEKGNDLLPFYRAGRPSASADIVPLDDRVHKKGGNNVPSYLIQALLQIRLPRGMYER